LRQRQPADRVDDGFVGWVFDRENRTFARDQSTVDKTGVFQVPSPKFVIENLFSQFMMKGMGRQCLPSWQGGGSDRRAGFAIARSGGRCARMDTVAETIGRN